MPAKEVMQYFREGHLHSGKSGKIVTSPKQAKAILLSYLRKEGKIAPMKNLLRRKRGNETDAN